MLAAQCNSIINKSPPPFCDVPVTKGFHPWKKREPGTASPCALSLTTDHSKSSNLGLSSSSIVGTGYLPYPRTHATTSVTTTPPYPAEVFASTPMPHSGCSDGVGPSTLKIHEDSTLSKGTGIAGSVYSRMHGLAGRPYDSWPFGVAGSHTQSSALKNDIAGGGVSVGVNGAGTWWDVHAGNPGVGSWLSDPSSMGRTQLSPSYVSASDFSLTHAALTSQSSTLLSSGQHIL